MNATVLDGLNPWLLGAAATNALAALLHLGCIVFGPSWYRFFGAGEAMARAVEAGRRMPALITLGIAAVLLLWAAYALAAAGAALPLPWVRPATALITAVFLLRGLGGLFLIRSPAGRSRAFWAWSSAICLAIGAVHAVGLVQVWT